jgi:archaellum biogenesis protein FlaJ (TadC family)
MQSEVFLSYDTLGEKSALVRTLYKNLKFTINASSDLGRYLKAAETAAELVSNNIQISRDGLK